MSPKSSEPQGLTPEERTALREAGVPLEEQETPSQSYLKVLASLGYRFRLNLCDDSIEVNGAKLSDITAAVLRMQMRDRGVRNMAAIEDAYTAEARKNAYHPIKDYLNGLKWDGYDHIGALAKKIQSDNEPVFYADETSRPLHEVYLRRWMLGAVAKVLDGEQNPMLVWDGPQGIGKSLLARWLCSGIPDYFIEEAINTQEKDCVIRLMSLFIWEVSELDATTRKADISALKAFITKGKVTVRKSYGRNDVSKPAICSFIGTVNNSTGFLADETGSRRFYICKLTGIDWSYRQLDIDQMWAQAKALYLAGEPHTLTVEEKAAQHRVNRQYEVETPLEDWISTYFTLTDDGDDALTMGEIITHLSEKGIKLGGSERGQAMELARVLTRLGLQRETRRYQGRPAKVWTGITISHSA